MEFGSPQSGQASESACPLEMSNFPQNPGTARNRHSTSFGWDPHQSTQATAFSIRPLMLSTAKAHRKPGAPRGLPTRVTRGLELTSLLSTSVVSRVSIARQWRP